METGQKALERLVSELTDLGMNTMANSLEGLYYSKDFLELDHLSLLQKIVGAEYNAKEKTELNLWAVYGICFLISTILY